MSSPGDGEREVRQMPEAAKHVSYVRTVLSGSGRIHAGGGNKAALWLAVGIRNARQDLVVQG